MSHISKQLSDRIITKLLWKLLLRAIKIIHPSVCHRLLSDIYTVCAGRQTYRQNVLQNQPIKAWLLPVTQRVRGAESANDGYDSPVCAGRQTYGQNVLQKQPIKALILPVTERVAVTEGAHDGYTAPILSQKIAILSNAKSNLFFFRIGAANY